MQKKTTLAAWCRRIAEGRVRAVGRRRKNLRFALLSRFCAGYAGSVMLQRRIVRAVGVIVTVTALGMLARGDAPRLPLQEPRVRKASPIVEPFPGDLQERPFRFFWYT